MKIYTTVTATNLHDLFLYAYEYQKKGWGIAGEVYELIIDHQVHYCLSIYNYSDDESSQ